MSVVKIKKRLNSDSPQSDETKEVEGKQTGTGDEDDICFAENGEHDEPKISRTEEKIPGKSGKSWEQHYESFFGAPSQLNEANADSVPGDAKITKNSMIKLGIMLSMICVAFLAIAYASFAPPTSVRTGSESGEKKVKNLVRSLRKEFKHQDSSTWTKIGVAVESSIEENNPFQPGTLVFLATEDTLSLTHCFVEKLATKINGIFSSPSSQGG